MIALPDNFYFTQYSLTAFENCPLKFRKRYVENLKLSSLPDKGSRKRVEEGRDFHLLAYRYFAGIDTELDEKFEEYPKLGTWLDNLRNNFKIEEGVKYLPEYKIRMAASSFRVEANFDLLMVREDCLEIWDWKTHGEQAGKRVSDGIRLKSSLQTMVYLYVLKEQAKLVTGKDIGSDKISMHYWQPDSPETLADIRYSNEMHESYGNELENRIKEIIEYDYSGFDKALYCKHCKYCEFNWLCNGQDIDFSAVDDI